MRSPKSRKKPAKTPQDLAADEAAQIERRRRISEIAYSIGARRGFAGGTDEAREDWLEAERIVDKKVDESPT